VSGASAGPLGTVNSLANSAGAPAQALQGLASTAVQGAKAGIQAKIMATVITVAIVAAGGILFNMFFVEKPIDVVDKLINAINEKDINTAMSCMDPAEEKLYKAGSSILSGFIGVNLTDVADLLPGLFKYMQSSGDMKADLKLEVTDVVSQEISGDDATVVVRVKALSTDENGRASDDAGEAKFWLHKFNAGWRITKLE
jgi:carbon monoxide dehydrogenase subunit G